MSYVTKQDGAYKIKYSDDESDIRLAYLQSTEMRPTNQSGDQWQGGKLDMLRRVMMEAGCTYSDPERESPKWGISLSPRSPETSSLRIQSTAIKADIGKRNYVPSYPPRYEEYLKTR